MLRRVVRRVLDGDAQWGSLTIQPDRFGTRYHLVVYPPGITATERRRVRIWRGWPLWGALLWILSQMVLIRHLDPWSALFASAGLVVVTAATACAMAGPARARVHTLAATLLPRQYDPVSKALCTTMHQLARTLREADSQRAQGVMSPAQFEMTWWRVYNEMAVVAHACIRDSSPGASQ
ncbi:MULTISPECIES: DUF6611 family protein [Mycolicibacterium]|uniref:SLATT domain-containing protein n=1 Tax=Mycolicibacterium austroafricanum TaxID=39687 RepID=A0ABT8HNR5_MYCAO|nr:MULTISPECIES: DUF6611 family protein [Mycolicibacterium]MCV7127336.1 hypothetical protein [Mycolicibacterium vanbaalenii PYR-1]MDN4522404.1 hypothetical protein [Mycolicibacterium austroafricanum]MDW5612687.1 DUF6611 family protein [Mycolicibacterium sp. D5.8-2]QZY48505.1 hypothetical protein K5L12_12895 [Mycolicibacterium austroafricanum]UJL27038.1 hypothetical protein HZU38_19040 [Mycolicibacterium vanbaalenii]